MSGLIQLGWGDLAIGAAFVLAHGLLSIQLRLGLEKRLLVATIRSIVQLTILGYLLVPVFSWGSPWLVMGMAAVMVALASREAIRRVSRRYRGISTTASASVLLSSGATVLLATTVILQSDPWWEPRYFIPFLGMLLGNSLTGISLGLDRCLELLDTGRDRVEALLARGATWWEAARPVTAESIRTGMVPIINTMSVVGVVSIPGMMTGQILGGTSPEQAARYQVLILFLIAGSIAIGVAAAVLISVRAMFDRCHRLRPDRLTRRTAGDS